MQCTVKRTTVREEQLETLYFFPGRKYWVERIREKEIFYPLECIKNSRDRSGSLLLKEGDLATECECGIRTRAFTTARYTIISILLPSVSPERRFETSYWWLGLEQRVNNYCCLFPRRSFRSWWWTGKSSLFLPYNMDTNGVRLFGGGWWWLLNAMIVSSLISVNKNWQLW